jgi:uncharacterized protein
LAYALRQRGATITKVFWFFFSKKNTFLDNATTPSPFSRRSDRPAGKAKVPSDSPRAEPVSLGERIQFIDILRGVALFGILTANMRGFFAPLDAYDLPKVLYPGHADVIAQGIVDTLFQGKFISIFSFLFGLGFAVQMSRATARGASFLGFYPRRLAALALFGLIHGILIWAGDILLTYALAGAILLLFRNRAQKTLLWWAGGLFSLPIVTVSVIYAVYLTPWRQKWMVRKPPDMAKLHAVIDTYAHGTLRQIMTQNWIEWKHELPFELFAIYAVALFLLGMWVWRRGIVQDLERYRPVMKRVCAWCLPVGLGISLYVVVVKAVTPLTTVSFAGFLAQLLWLPGAHILAAGYMSGLALLFLNVRFRPVLHPFAAVGRMALTNYLLQSVFCTWLFYHYGTGWFGGVGPALGFLPTVALYAAQLVLSNVWLARYRFGPMEWIWRALTYGYFPAMRAPKVEAATG